MNKGSLLLVYGFDPYDGYDHNYGDDISNLSAYRKQRSKQQYIKNTGSFLCIANICNNSDVCLFSDRYKPVGLWHNWYFVHHRYIICFAADTFFDLSKLRSHLQRRYHLETSLMWKL